MALTDLYAQMSADWARGPALDTRIPGWVQRAIRHMETLHTFQWMARSGTFTLPGNTGVNLFPFPNALVKSLDYVRVVSYGPLTGALSVPRKPLQRVNGEDVVHVGYGLPEAYWLDGMTSVYLDKFTDQDAVFLVVWKEFTDSTTDATQTPTILVRAYEAVQAKAMEFAAQGLRDTRMYAIYKDEAQEAIAAAVAADAEMEWSSQDDMRMEFTPLGGDPYFRGWRYARERGVF